MAAPINVSSKSGPSNALQRVEGHRCCAAAFCTTRAAPPMTGGFKSNQKHRTTAKGQGNCKCSSQRFCQPTEQPRDRIDREKKTPPYVPRLSLFLKDLQQPRCHPCATLAHECARQRRTVAHGTTHTMYTTPYSTTSRQAITPHRSTS